MKFLRLLFVTLWVLAPICSSYAQSKGDVYRRNSLCVGVITPSSTNSNSVTRYIHDAAAEYQVSDKFNDHKIQLSNIDLNRIEVSQQDINSFRKNDQKGFLNKYNSFMSSLTNSMAAAQGIQGVSMPELAEEEMVAIKLRKYLETQKIPALLVSKWFNASNNLNDGSYYNMSLIQERGAYNASELDILKAKESVRGMSILKDAGMELIPNTYVVIVSLKMETMDEYLIRLRRERQKQEETMAALGVNTVEQKSTSNSSEEPGLIKSLNSWAAKHGLKVNTNMSTHNNTPNHITATCYLFKLKWDEDTENLFINKYYEKHPSVLLNSNDFELVYMGYKTSSKIISAISGNQNSTISGNQKNDGAKLTLAELAKLATQTTTNNPEANRAKFIKRATIQAIDKCIADLQKKHEDFKVKTPIIDVNDKDVTAFIGYKEGLDGTTKFEVLEKSYNKSKNTFRYKKVGTLKVDKKRIWDNRYNIDGLPADVGDAEEGIINSNVDRTFLKGSTKNLAPGMLIRQIK